MNRDNMSALVVGIGVVVLIAGFGIYFNSPELNQASGNTEEFVSAISDEGVQIDKSQFRTAPELRVISNYINTDQVSLADLESKVVLIDFWTYSCINCIRTIPYLNAWHEKYADDGLVIVGVHTPEFDFEKTRQMCRLQLKSSAYSILLHRTTRGRLGRLMRTATGQGNTLSTTRGSYATTTSAKVPTMRPRR